MDNAFPGLGTVIALDGFAAVAFASSFGIGVLLPALIVAPLLTQLVVALR